MTPEIVILIVLALACLYGAWQLGRAHERERLGREGRSHRLPNWLVAGLEDSQAVSLDLLLETQTFLRVYENRLQHALRILGETRAGTYTPDRPAQKVRANGRDTAAERIAH